MPRAFRPIDKPGNQVKFAKIADLHLRQRKPYYSSWAKAVSQMKRLKQAIADEVRSIEAAFLVLEQARSFAYPVASVMVALLVTFLSVVLLLPAIGLDVVEMPVVPRLVALLACWILSELISTAFAVALLNLLSAQNDGKSADFVQSLRKVIGCGWAILQFACIAAPLSAIVFYVRPFTSLVRMGMNLVSRRLFGEDVDLLLMMALPVIALEKVDCLAAFRRGRTLVREKNTGSKIETPKLTVIMTLLWVPALIIFSPPLLGRGPTGIRLALGGAGVAIGVTAILLAEHLQMFVTSVHGFECYRPAITKTLDSQRP
jgi:hypothetical protein